MYLLLLKFDSFVLLKLLCSICEYFPKFLIVMIYVFSLNSIAVFISIYISKYLIKKIIDKQL